MQDAPKQKSEDRVVFLDPKIVHPPAVSSRHESAFTGADFTALKQSIDAAGVNVQPILVRHKKGAEGEFEITFGERRHRACLECNLEVRAIIDESSDDIHAFFQTVRENEGRRAMSAYELGRQVRYGISRQFFESQEDASRKLCRHKSNVSRAVAIASLPVELVSAFRSPAQIRYQDVEILAAALERSPELVLAEAMKIRTFEIPLGAKEVIRRLRIASGENVASCNIPRKIRIEFDGASLGTLSFDKSGKTHLQLDVVLDFMQQQALEAMLQRFCKQKLKKASSKIDSTQPMTFRQADKQLQKLKTKLANLQRSA